MLRPLVASAALLVLAAAVPAQDAAEALRLEQAERALIQAANDWRIGQGVPPVAWSEQLACVLRELTTKAIAGGYEGGEYPRDIGRAPQRARDLWGWRTQIYDNFSTTTPDTFDAAGIIAEQIAHPAIKQFPNAELRLGAAAVARTAGGKWICLIALAQGDHERLEALQKEIAPELERLASADPPTRAAACTVLGQRNTIEALPGLRGGLRHAEPATRAAAATGLSAVRSRGIVPALLAALADADATVRAAAGAALAKLTGRTDLGDDAEKWRQWWERAIDSFVLPPDGSAAKDATPVGDAATAGKSVDELLAEWNEACERKDTLRKTAILEALRDLPESPKNPKVEAVMRKGLGDADGKVRIEAIRGVARLKLKSTLPALMKMSEDFVEKDDETARFALLGLAQIGDLRGLKAFTGSAWSSKNWKVLAARVFAIRYMRHGESVEWLLDLFTAGRGRKGGGWGGGGQFGQGQVFDSLEFLTGESLGRDPDAWRDWWKKKKASFRCEPLPDDYEVEGLFPKRRDDGRKGDGGKGKGGDKG